VTCGEEALQYTGMTEDLEKRLAKYNNKELSFWTIYKKRAVQTALFY
jgi:predicted GIY-YIG superfamily endonuclease